MCPKIFETSSEAVLVIHVVYWSHRPMCCGLLSPVRLFFDPMGCSLPGSSVHGIFQARILEWVAMPSSRGSSRARDRTQVSCIAGRFFTNWATREALLDSVWRQISCLAKWVSLPSRPESGEEHMCWSQTDLLSNLHSMALYMLLQADELCLSDVGPYSAEWLRYLQFRWWSKAQVLGLDLPGSSAPWLRVVWPLSVSFLSCSSLFLFDLPHLVW